MKNRILITIIFAFFVNEIFAQVGISATNMPPNPAAMLDIMSSTKGLLIPRMTTAQKNAIPNKVEGLTVYDLDIKQFSYWTDPGSGFVWQNFGGPISGVTGVGWQENGTHIENTNTGNVGIGVLNPTAKLAIFGTDQNGTLAVSGSNHTSHFNYPQNGLENTFIRGGANDSHVLLNDSPGLGNVGIGTATPYRKLDVVGTGQFFGGNKIAYFNNIGDYDGGVLSLIDQSYERLMFDGKNIQAVKPAPNFRYSSGALKINPFGGNVGIGTNFEPEYKLHLWNNDDQLIKIDGENSVVAFHDNQSNAQYGFFRAWSEAPFNPAGFHGLEIGVPPIVGGDPAKHLMFSTNYNLRMVIMDNGNVGIGTINPTHKLSVNGGIRAKEIRVNTGWADYVFEPTYKLKPLATVEQFIKDHGHLPDIPAASIIQAEGLDVGELQTKMMAKIEELTLYLIEANKKIEKLENLLTTKK
jgi:hypothetical protein